MRALLDATDATQMFWITQVILKDVKIGYGETAILRHYHQDAVDLYNLCCDLRRVCETLAVRSERLKRQDLEPGALVKAMMASRAHGCAKAFEAMRDRPFVIETKFDGERIQVHRTDANSPLRYFTRNNNDFGPRGYDVLDRLFRARLKPSKTRCVFDGELVVWNTRDGVYAPFGYIKSLVNAIRDNRGGDERCVPEDPRGPAGGGARRFASRAPGEPAEKREEGLFEDGDGDGVDEGCLSEDVDVDVPDEASSACEPLRVKDLELVYVAFDVLYDEDRSVIDRPLRERHEILKNAFLDVTECDDVVQGDGGVFLGSGPDPNRFVTRGRISLNVPASEAGDPPNPDALVGATLRDVEDALWARIERQEEGLVLKDLESRWVPGERDKKWVKLKPDYLPTEDLDVVVVGGFKGTGALRGGKIAEYLVGIVEAPKAVGDERDPLGDERDPLGDEGTKTPGFPTRVISFSKVGTGMSAGVMERLRKDSGRTCCRRRAARARRAGGVRDDGRGGRDPGRVDRPPDKLRGADGEGGPAFGEDRDVRVGLLAPVPARHRRALGQALARVPERRRARAARARGRRDRRARRPRTRTRETAEGDRGEKKKKRKTRERARRKRAPPRAPRAVGRAPRRRARRRAARAGRVFHHRRRRRGRGGGGARGGAEAGARRASAEPRRDALRARHAGNTHVVATREAKTSVRFEAATRNPGGRTCSRPSGSARASTPVASSRRGRSTGCS